MGHRESPGKPAGVSATSGNSPLFTVKQAAPYGRAAYSPAEFAATCGRHPSWAYRLLYAWTRHKFDTRPRNRWYKMNRLQFIVPNPMTAPKGTTRNQKISTHTLSNTGPRRFLVVEFDFDLSRSSEETRLFTKLEKQKRDVRDLCAALLLHLAEKAPLALVVYSGGKSLHGWFYCADVADEKVRCFFQYALTLGADGANWCRSQFARMPDGLRENGRRQTVYFFNPAVVK